jgi:putative restriction endonuclease
MPIRGNAYTRDNLRDLFDIRTASLNNGVFHFRERCEVWLFVTENKQADREQYVDKLVADTLHWQGQRMGRTDSLIVDHKRIGETLLIFYRKEKYEFDGAGFMCEGVFEYVSHSGRRPADFVLRRAAL